MFSSRPPQWGSKSTGCPCSSSPRFAPPCIQNLKSYSFEKGWEYTILLHNTAMTKVILGETGSIRCILVKNWKPWSLLSAECSYDFLEICSTCVLVTPQSSSRVSVDRRGQEVGSRFLSWFQLWSLPASPPVQSPSRLRKEGWGCLTSGWLASSSSWRLTGFHFVTGRQGGWKGGGRRSPEAAGRRSEKWLFVS